MRSRTVITWLCCGFCPFAAGCTSTAMTSTDSAGTVKPEERSTTAGEQGQEAQGEAPAGEVEERGVLRRLPLTTPGLPEISDMAPPRGGYVAPTADLTLIANNLTVLAKSLSVIVKVPKGLTVGPVNVRIDFSSPSYGGTFQKSATYSSAGGVGLNVHDSEGNSQPRWVDTTITLSDNNGNSYNFDGLRQIFLTPLYRVTFSELYFSVTSICPGVPYTDPTYPGQYLWGWWAPDGTWHSKLYGCCLNPWMPIYIFDVEMSWSAFQMMHMQAIGFWHVTKNSPPPAAPFFQASTLPILPQKHGYRRHGVVVRDLQNIAKPSPSCIGLGQYTLGGGVARYRWSSSPPRGTH